MEFEDFDAYDLKQLARENGWASSEEDSDFGCKFELDEEYGRQKPAPYDIKKYNCIEIRATKNQRYRNNKKARDAEEGTKTKGEEAINSFGVDRCSSVIGARNEPGKVLEELKNVNCGEEILEDNQWTQVAVRGRRRKEAREKRNEDQAREVSTRKNDDLVKVATINYEEELSNIEEEDTALVANGAKKKVMRKRRRKRGKKTTKLIEENSVGKGCGEKTVNSEKENQHTRAKGRIKEKENLRGNVLSEPKMDLLFDHFYHKALCDVKEMKKILSQLNHFVVYDPSNAYNIILTTRNLMEMVLRNPYFYLPNYAAICCCLEKIAVLYENRQKKKKLSVADFLQHFDVINLETVLRLDPRANDRIFEELVIILDSYLERIQLDVAKSNSVGKYYKFIESFGDELQGSYSHCDDLYVPYDNSNHTESCLNTSIFLQTQLDLALVDDLTERADHFTNENTHFWEGAQSCYPHSTSSDTSVCDNAENSVESDKNVKRSRSNVKLILFLFCTMVLQEIFF